MAVENSHETNVHTYKGLLRTLFIKYEAKFQRRNNEKLCEKKTSINKWLDFIGTTLGSISSIFYRRVFLYESKFWKFSQFGSWLFGERILVKKITSKMLMKMTPAFCYFCEKILIIIILGAKVKSNFERPSKNKVFDSSKLS